jgi:hypothetical protein
MIRLATVALVACFLLALTIGASAQQSLAVLCSAPAPIVETPGTVRVRAWADPAHAAVTYRWAATVGRIDASGPEVDWRFGPAEPGARPPYRATVRVDSKEGGSGTCTIELWPSTEGRGPAERESGRTLLAGGAQAPAGYGLYSYLLLGSGPTVANRERYLKAIEAWWSLVPDLIQLERYLKREQLNMMAIPVQSPVTKVSPEVLLENYDFARARVLLRAVGRSGRDGPYLVSSLRPLDDRRVGDAPYLFQDLSAVPPNLAAAWTKEFLNQTAQQRFWEPRTPAMLGLRMRTTISVLAVGLADVKQGLAEWIGWGGGATPEP